MGNLYTGIIISDTPVEDGSVTEGNVEEATKEILRNKKFKLKKGVNKWQRQ